MKTKLVIHYNSPEGPKESNISSDEDALKLIKGWVTAGVNIIRETDQLYIPPHSIIAVTHVKTNT